MDFMAHPEEALHWSSQVFPAENDFYTMATSYVLNNMGIKLPIDDKLMETLWFTTNIRNPSHPGETFSKGPFFCQRK